MNRILACVFLSLGSVLVIYGLNTLPSVLAAVARLLEGAQPDQALWFLLAGIASALVGAVSFLRTPSIRPPASFRRSGHRR